MVSTGCTYEYDEVGNILRMEQGPSSGTGWPKCYFLYADNNSLWATFVSGDAEGTPSNAYRYTDCGAMTSMPHLPIH